MNGFLTRPVDRMKPVLSDFVWMDRNRLYFIFNWYLMEKGCPYTRTRLRKDDPAPNKEPNMVDMNTPKPITSELYYNSCGQIDRYNRCC